MSLSADLIVTLVSALLLLVGLIGIIVPILPGSITIIIGLLIWALVIGGPIGWTVFAVGAACCLAGMTVTYVLTGRVMRRESIPNRSVLIGLICGVVGMFVLPALGLPIGFILGLFLSELARVRNARTAVKTSWQALKATGLGMLIEFGLACAAVIVFAVGVWRYTATVGF